MDLSQIAAPLFLEATKQLQEKQNLKLFSPATREICGVFLGPGPLIPAGRRSLQSFLIKAADITWVIPAWDILCDGTGDGYFKGFLHEAPGPEFEYMIRYNGKGDDGFHKLTVWKKKIENPASVTP
jgi:hypothetical protein